MRSASVVIAAAILFSAPAVMAAPGHHGTKAVPIVHKNAVLITPPAGTGQLQKGVPIVAGQAIGQAQPQVNVTTLPLTLRVAPSNTTPTGTIPPVVTKDDGTDEPTEFF